MAKVLTAVRELWLAWAGDVLRSLHCGPRPKLDADSMNWEEYAGPVRGLYEEVCRAEVESQVRKASRRKGRKAQSDVGRGVRAVERGGPRRDDGSAPRPTASPRQLGFADLRPSGGPDGPAAGGELRSEPEHDSGMDFGPYGGRCDLDSGGD